MTLRAIFQSSTTGQALQVLVHANVPEQGHVQTRLVQHGAVLSSRAGEADVILFDQSADDYAKDFRACSMNPSAKALDFHWVEDSINDGEKRPYSTYLLVAPAAPVKAPRKK